MKKIISLLIVFAVCMLIGLMPQPALAEDEYGWKILGGCNFSDGSTSGTTLYVYEGTTYVAYRNAEGKSVVKKYTGEGGWETVGSAGFSADYAHYLSLYVYDGTPYVAYSDYDNSSKATVMKYTGEGETGWEAVGSPGFSAKNTAYISFYVYDGTPYVAYQDCDNSSKATVMKYTGEGETGWETVGSAFSAGRASYISLYVYEGTPYVAYMDEGNSSKATVMKYTGEGETGWQNVGSPGLSAGWVYDLSLYVYNGTPYLAYRDVKNYDRATVMKYTGEGETGWQPVGSVGFSVGGVYDPSLYVYEGTPYVAYRNNSSGKATVMKYTGEGETGWEAVGSAGFSADRAHYLSLYVYEGTPYVAYGDYDEASNAWQGVVMYYGELPETLPELTADTTDNSVDNDIEITFPADSAFASAVTGVSYDGNALNADQYTVDTADNNKITLHPGAGGNACLRTPRTADVVVTASGYEDVSVSQTITAGAAASMTATTQPEPGAASGDAFASQPIVTLYDQYGNACSTGASASASVTASAKAGTGSWTIGGTASVTASSGVAAFTDLTCTLTSAGTGAVTFSCGGLSTDSDIFTIPAVSDAEAVAAAKDALTDGSVDVAYGATQADKTAAVQSYVNGLLDDVSAAAGVTATVTYNGGTGQYDVALSKGSETDSKSLSMTVNESADPDIATVAGARTAAAGATYSDLTQAEAPDEAAAKAKVKAVAVNAVNDSSVAVTINTVSYTAPAAGTSADPDGTDGSYSFTVTVSKGIRSATTEAKTVAITATAYTGVTDAQAVAAAKDALTDGTVEVAYGAAQADKTAAVQSYVNGLLDDVSAAAGVTATVTYNSDTGNYDVALSKGSVNDSKSLSMTVNVAKKGTSAKTLTPGMVSSIAARTYTGSALEPTVTIMDGDTTLKKGTDYTVSYVNNTDAGTATAIIRGKGDYKDTVRKTFIINKAGTTVAELPTSSDILVVGKLSDSALTGGSGSVDGTFAWTDPDAVVAKTGEYSVTFTPASDNYDSCTCDVPLTVNEQVDDDETGVVYDFSETDLPDDVNSISLVVSLIDQEGEGNDANTIISGLLDDDFPSSDATRMVLYDLSLVDQDGNTITDFAGTITVRIPILEGMSGDLHVYWYEEDNGTLVDMNATQQDGYLYFSTNHFSVYAIAASSASASADSSSPEPGTGSHTVLIIVLALLSAALCALVIVFLLRRKRKMDTE